MQRSAMGTHEMGTSPGPEMETGLWGEKNLGGIADGAVVFKQALAKPFKYFNIIINI